MAVILHIKYTAHSGWFTSTTAVYQYHQRNIWHTSKFPCHWRYQHSFCQSLEISHRHQPHVLYLNAKWKFYICYRSWDTIWLIITYPISQPARQPISLIWWCWASALLWYNNVIRKRSNDYDVTTTIRKENYVSLRKKFHTTVNEFS